MNRYRVGHAGSIAAGKSFARYLTTSDRLTDTASSHLAAYHTSAVPLSEMDVLGQQVANGDISYSEALDSLMHTAIHLAPDDADIDSLEDRLGMALANAAGQAELRDALATEGQSDATVREDMSQRMATLMGIDVSRPLLEFELANLLNGHRTDGAAIPGRKEPPNDKQSVAYLELILAPDKSLSVAWALAPTEAERAILLRLHADAVTETMQFVEEVIGVRRRAPNGERPWEQRGEIPYLTVQHYTARPVAEIAAVDQAGVPFTDFVELPRQPDPHLHTHVIIPSVVLTEDGVGKLDLDRLNGKIHEIGGVYQATIARNARRLGIKTQQGPQGEARFSDVANHVRSFYGRRSEDGRKAAREMAHNAGLHWDSMHPKQQRAFLERAYIEHRENKRSGPSDFVEWAQLAKDKINYTHQSVLRPDTPPDASSAARKREAAYKASLPFVEDALNRNPTISGEDIRVMAVRGFVATGGLSSNPSDDINAVTNAYRQIGIYQRGERVPLVWGKAPGLRDIPKWTVTSGLNLRMEQDVIQATRAAAMDPTAALSTRQVDHAVTRFLASRPDIDPASDQWQTQHKMAIALGTQGRLSIGIGAAGSGKGTVLTPLVSAWQEDGRHVYGISTAWRQATALGETGIAKRDQAAIAAFLHRVDTGHYKLNAKSVVVIDEISMVSTSQFRDLLQLQHKHGFQIAAIGDPKQCTSVEAGPVIDLIQQALPHAIPEIVTSIRQRTVREREIAKLFRDGDTAQALDMKRADNSVMLVAGGREATAERVADVWLDRHLKNIRTPDYSLAVLTGTREDARLLSATIRSRLQREGAVAQNAVIITAKDNAGDVYDMPLSAGDRVFALRRVYQGHRDMIANNGDVLTVNQVSATTLTVTTETGIRATLPWKAFADDTGMIRMAPGYAQTIDAAQGLTATETITAFVSGTQGVLSIRNYVAASRHQVANWLVISESHERKQVSQGQSLGQNKTPTPNEVWANVAKNLGRTDVKQSAVESLRVARSVQRGSVSDRFRAAEPKERVARPAWTRTSALHQRREEASKAIVDIVKELVTTTQQEQSRQHQRQH